MLQQVFVNFQIVVPICFHYFGILNLFLPKNRSDTYFAIKLKGTRGNKTPMGHAKLCSSLLIFPCPVLHSIHSLNPCRSRCINKASLSPFSLSTERMCGNEDQSKDRKQMCLTIPKANHAIRGNCY